MKKKTVILILSSVLFVSCAPEPVKSPESSPSVALQNVLQNTISGETNIQKTIMDIMKRENQDILAENLVLDVSDRSIAIFSDDGATLVPLKKGSVDIIAKDKSSGKVLKKLTVNVDTYVVPTIKMRKGKTLLFTFPDTEVIWISSDINILTVEKGLVTSISEGSAEILIKDSQNRIVSKMKIIVVP